MKPRVFATMFNSKQYGQIVLIASGGVGDNPAIEVHFEARLNYESDIRARMEATLSLNGDRDPLVELHKIGLGEAEILAREFLDQFSMVSAN